MTLDYMEDFKEACVKEGYKYFICITKDGEGYVCNSTLHELPDPVKRMKPDGTYHPDISRLDDFKQMVETCFQDEDDEPSVD